MYYKKGFKIIFGLVGVLITLLLVGGIQASSLAASPAEDEISPNGVHADGAGFSLFESDMPAVPAAPSACHTVTGFASTLERTNFCVYYNSPTTAATAGDVADTVEDYWDRFVTDFGFLAPLDTSATNKIEVRLINTTSCNGSAWDNYIELYTGCFGSDENMMQVTGHELFHRVQFNYDSDWHTNWTSIGWFYEGTARASEDMVFDAVDNWAGAMGVGFSFNREVNEFLASPNNDLTSFARRYEAALWWKYFSEQFGSVTTEPEVGIDAFLTLWEKANASSDIAAVNQALSDLGAGMDFNQAFRRFVVANYTKDLTGLPDGSYNYIDEEQAGNPAQYGPVQIDDGGTINPTTSMTRNNQQVKRYAAKYYSANVASSCQVVTASFHKDSGSSQFYHLITRKADAFATHREGTADDWKQSFLNDGITKIAAVIGGRNNSATVDVELGCADPAIDIKMPNNVAKAFVGPFDAPGKFLVHVLVTDSSSPTNPVVAGLTKDDFKVKVGGLNALVTAGGFIQEQYWLVVQAPIQPSNTTYNLEVYLEEPGTTTIIATDTNANSVQYVSDNLDNVLVIDRSGSMGYDNKLNAAKTAANFYVDITRNADGLAVVPYNHNVDPAPFDMQTVNITVRNAAKTYINSLTASGATSIGDGLDEAVNQKTASPTVNPNCSFVLLSDGMENSSLYWSQVMTDVVDTGCPVTSIAFGPDSNETLMQDIATETGGLMYYNDVFVSSPATQAIIPIPIYTIYDMVLDLGNTYEYAQGTGENRQRLLSEKGILLTYGDEMSHTVKIDDSIAQVLFALDWVEPASEMELRLEKPNGSMLNCADQDSFFSDYINGHLGCRVSITDPADYGEWTVWVKHLSLRSKTIHYQVYAGARSNLTAMMILPDRFGHRFMTGQYLPIYAVLSNNMPIPNAQVFALITAPDGSQTSLQLHDDGMHDDGSPGDGIYGNLYTKLNQSDVNPPQGDDGGDPVDPQDEGGFSVKLTADGADFQREAKGGFAIMGSESMYASGYPDFWEDAYGSPGADPDLDELVNEDEYLSGTDPLNSDSDGGGENDGSEVHFLQDPLDPADDLIEAPEFLQTEAGIGEVRLTYDVKPEYKDLLVYRSLSQTGPWMLHIPELGLTGVYSDTENVVNETTYYYLLMAWDTDPDPHKSALILSEGVTPSEDPIPPEAHVLINGGAAEFKDPSMQVKLSFVPYDYLVPDYTEPYDDIEEMIISNDPTFAGAAWEPFVPDNVDWTLGLTAPGEVAKVYVRFKDDFGNESVGVEIGSILYNPEVLFMPLVSRNAQ